MNNVLPSKLACLVLVMTSGMPAKPGIPIKASHDAGILVLSDIFLDGHGPFGTTIDTCNASSLIRLQIARRPAFRALQWSPFPQPRWETFTPSWTVLP